MAVPVTVRAVTSKSDLKRFIDYPYTFYKGNPHWVPPLRQDTEHILNPKKNAFFEHGKIQCFLAEDAAGNVVGRIGSVVNGMHLKKYNDGNGFFGFFECIEDYDVASALLNAAKDWLVGQGLTGMRGPANPSLNDTAGLLVEGFDREPFILMPYNPPYHETFLLRYGFQRAMTMWAYYIHKKYVKTDKLKRGVEIIMKRNPGLKLRNMNMNRYDEEARNVLRIYNDAWSENWGHVPMTDAEFAQLAKQLKQIVDPNIVFILELDGEPVAFSIQLPNLNQALKHIPDGRLFPLGLPKLLARAKFGGIYECRTPLMGVLQKHQGKGFDAILNLAIIEQGPKHGYDGSEMSWVLDSNHVLRNALTSFGGVVDKQYAMFEMRFA
jgi:GNAT superfamily N-acetyltransferase